MEEERAKAAQWAAEVQGARALDPDAWNDYGVALFHAGAKQEALAALDRALELQPDYGYRYAARAWMRQAMKDFDGARADYARAIALDPDDAISLNNLGLLEEQAGFFQQARDRFAAADALSHLLEEAGIETAPAPAPPDPEEPVGSVWGWMRHAVWTAEGRSEFAAFVRSGLTFRR